MIAAAPAYPTADRGAPKPPRVPQAPSPPAKTANSRSLRWLDLAGNGLVTPRSDPYIRVVVIRDFVRVAHASSSACLRGRSKARSDATEKQLHCSQLR